jgi:hypothetical protein
MNEFKVGDKVRCLIPREREGTWSFLNGRIGVIVKFYGSLCKVYIKGLEPSDHYCLPLSWIEPAKKEFLIYRRQE